MNFLKDYESDSEGDQPEKLEKCITGEQNPERVIPGKTEEKLDFFSLGSLKRPVIEQEMFMSKRIAPARRVVGAEEEKSPYLVTQDYSRVVQGQKLDIQELHKIGHNMKDGPIQIVEVNQGERLREFQRQNYSSDHILPAKDTRKRHTIFSLASKATEEEGLMESRRSHLDETRKLSKKKYGF